MASFSFPQLFMTIFVCSKFIRYKYHSCKLATQGRNTKINTIKIPNSRAICYKINKCLHKINERFERRHITFYMKGTHKRIRSIAASYVLCTHIIL